MNMNKVMNAREVCNPVPALPLFLSFLLTLITNAGFCQTRDSLIASRTLKQLSLEELMDVEVTSVSKRPEKLTEVASAIQVITQKDIRNAGVKTLAEALRLAPNLQVARVNASQWAISARGFNNVLANKLLVLIDGRTVYTPLYAGVFWDVQNLLLEEVDRIEVISGPGGTLWGANAVNGVINIITKGAKDTKGLFVEGAVGTSLRRLGSIRYGGMVGKNISYRIYGTGFKMGNTIDTNGVKAKDHWPVLQGGVQLDWEASANNKLSFQQNTYYGRPNPTGGDTSIVARGDNVMARWNHNTASGKSGFQLQAYYDHTWRNFGNGFTENLQTYDIDWQNRYQPGQKHVLTYGLNLRMMDHQVTNLKLFAFLPEFKRLYRYSGFLQYEIMMLRERLRFTVGSKVEHNNYTGFEYQPNARLTWTPTKNQTVWAAVSRAVRTPARIDRDFFLYVAPDFPFISGNNRFASENMFAYELGWRLQPLENLSMSLATFYNEYNNIRSVEPGPPPFGLPVTFGNGVKGKTYGMELSGSYQPTSWWNLRGGYTFLRKDLSVKPGSKDMNKGTAESDDPVHQFLIQSAIDISGRVELGTVIRYVDKLPKPYVQAYTGLDLRAAWNLCKTLELSIVGQDLLDKRHLEFIPASPAPRDMQRSVYGEIICRF